MDRDDVLRSLADLSALVEGDGAAFELVAVDGAGASVTLELILNEVECLDCVMPHGYLEMLSLDILRRTLPDLTRVSIIDPREGSARPVSH